ncbi:MAG: hypothetical protein M3464_21395 [Chloroflexota bacterium]|nr:hypothetical protein [Chloroflexota bacterium]
MPAPACGGTGNATGAEARAPRAAWPSSPIGAGRLRRSPADPNACPVRAGARLEPQTPVLTSACAPSYPGVCIPPSPPELDGGEIGVRRFMVVPPDPHGFDGDHDGIGCEGKAG